MCSKCMSSHQSFWLARLMGQSFQNLLRSYPLKQICAISFTQTFHHAGDKMQGRWSSYRLQDPLL